MRGGNECGGIYAGAKVRSKSCSRRSCFPPRHSPRLYGQNYNQFIGFGDSTIDSGFYKILSSPGGGATFNSLWTSGVAHGAGKPTSSPGLMSSEALASYFGLTAIPANEPGGTNFATSGAKEVTINSTATGGFQAAIPVVTQIANYLAANGGRANGNALYLISSGGNDVSFATGGTGTGPFPASPSAYLIGAANSLAASLATLQGRRRPLSRGHWAALFVSSGRRRGKRGRRVRPASFTPRRCGQALRRRACLSSPPTSTRCGLRSSPVRPRSVSSSSTRRMSHAPSPRA